MLITPNDIQQKTFRVALRGYAEDEVDEFLDEIVAAIAEYENRLDQADAKVRDLEAEVAESRKTEDAMRRTFALAQRTADEITEEARREAEKLVSDARAEATHLTASQGAEKNNLIAELDRLRVIVQDVKARLADVAVDVDARMSPLEDDITRAVESAEPYRPPLHAVADDIPDLDADPGDDQPSLTGVLSGFGAESDGGSDIGDEDPMGTPATDEEIPLSGIVDDDPAWLDTPPSPSFDDPSADDSGFDDADFEDAGSDDAGLEDAGFEGAGAETGGFEAPVESVREAVDEHAPADAADVGDLAAGAESGHDAADELFRDDAEVESISGAPDEEDDERPRRPWERF